MSIILLILYIIFIFVRPQEWWQPLHGFEVLDYTAICMILVVFIKTNKEQWRILLQLPEAKMALLLLLAATASWLPFWVGGALTIVFIDFGKTILLYFIIILFCIFNPKNFRIILWTMLLCIIWMAVHGILQIHRGYGFGGQPPLLRLSDNVYQIKAFGIFNDPNDLCLVFIIAIPILFSEYRIIKNLLVKWAVVGAIFLSGYAAWLTNSRGGVIGVFGMLSGHAIINAKGFKRWFLVLSSAVFLTIIAPSRAAKGLIVDKGRTIAWGDGLNFIKSSPIYGIGFNMFEDLSSAHKAAHNSYIQTLGELGLMGYIPWFLLIFFTLAHLYGAIKACRAMNLKNDDIFANKLQLSAMFSALSGYLVAAYFLSRSYTSVLYFFLAMTIAKVVNVAIEYNMQEDIFGSSRRYLKQGLVLCFLSIPVLWIVIRIANAL